MHLQGAIFLRGSHRSLGVRLAAASGRSRRAGAGAKQMILLHVVASGKAWIETDDSERHWASAGDVIVLPYGDGHRMGGTEPAEWVSIAELIDPPPWQQMPVIRHGGTAPPRSRLRLPDLRPPAVRPAATGATAGFVVRPPAGPARDWVRARRQLRHAADRARRGQTGSKRPP